MSDTECAFHLICSVLQFTDGSLFILLATNSYNWLSKCIGPHIRAGPCWEGIWAALLPGRECVCRVHQSLPLPAELNKLIGRLVAASSRHCGPYSSKHRAQKALQWTNWKACPEADSEESEKGISLFFNHTLPHFCVTHHRASNLLPSQSGFLQFNCVRQQWAGCKSKSRKCILSY